MPQASPEPAWREPLTYGPRRHLPELRLGELWAHRDLALVLAWRDVQVRYKQTALGVVWVVLQPALASGVFALVLGRFVGLGSATRPIPYWLFALAGIVPWFYIANSVSQATNSLTANTHLVTRVYFPRVLMPLAVTGAALVDLSVGILVLIAAGFLAGARPGASLLLAPLAAAGLVALAAGFGAVLATLSARYRDFRYLVPFALQVWMFLTPVVFPASVIPTRYQWLIWVNPAAGLIEALRAIVLGTAVNWGLAADALGLAVGVLILGLIVFALLERELADVI